MSVAFGLPSVLAQRAASEGPRWTRAVEDQAAPIPEEITNELGGNMRGQTRCSPLLVQRAQLGIHQASPVWPVSLVQPVSCV